MTAGRDERIERLERAMPPEVDDVVARERLAEELAGIRERWLASGVPLPPRREMSVMERFALASSPSDFAEVRAAMHSRFIELGLRPEAGGVA